MTASIEGKKFKISKFCFQFPFEKYKKIEKKIYLFFLFFLNFLLTYHMNYPIYGQEIRLNNKCRTVPTGSYFDDPIFEYLCGYHLPTKGVMDFPRYSFDV